jgi:hypothetical protein
MSEATEIKPCKQITLARGLMSGLLKPGMRNALIVGRKYGGCGAVE